MENFDNLLEIARRKSAFDQNNTWYSGSETYLSGLRAEIDEVVEEIPKNRTCYLEDELGDLLWNYLNTALALERETSITVESVLKRAFHKYQARVSGIESGISWHEVKLKQKQDLAQEYVSKTHK